MKELHAAGDHVDEVTVRAKIGAAWPDTLKAVFDGSKADIKAAGDDIAKSTLQDIMDALEAAQKGR